VLRWFAILLLALFPWPVLAQEWAKKMFDATTHDFGTVARGSKIEHSFQLKNLYEEDVHIAAVRSSCGCTTPEVSKHDLKTFETAQIVAHFNTSSFLGPKSATITVVFDRPFPAEVQLNVGGVIRGDVVCTPGAINFGTLDQGVVVVRHIAVSHTGRNDWQILDARSANPHLEVELTETARERGNVSYDMLVRLLSTAPVGYVKDELTLVTNDKRTPELILAVEGHVTAALSVSPSPLYMGIVRPGEKVTKQLIVRGKQAFRVVDVVCNGDCFAATAGREARRTHVIPIMFTAPNKSGKVSREITIETDQGQSAGEQGASARLTAYAVVETSAEQSSTPTETAPAEKKRAAEVASKRAKVAIGGSKRMPRSTIKLPGQQGAGTRAAGDPLGRWASDKSAGAVRRSAPSSSGLKLLPRTSAEAGDLPPTDAESGAAPASHPDEE
jgi:hypothetical protein